MYIISKRLTSNLKTSPLYIESLQPLSHLYRAPWREKMRSKVGHPLCHMDDTGQGHQRAVSRDETSQRSRKKAAKCDLEQREATTSPCSLSTCVIRDTILRSDRRVYGNKFSAFVEPTPFPVFFVFVRLGRVNVSIDRYSRGNFYLVFFIKQILFLLKNAVLEWVNVLHAKYCPDN